MSKWINTSTGEQVPANEVRELTTGSGIFVHETIVQRKQITFVSGRTGRVPVMSTGDVSIKVVDGYAVKIGDDETYDPAKHNVGAQVLNAQNALRLRQQEASNATIAAAAAASAAARGAGV